MGLKVNLRKLKDRHKELKRGGKSDFAEIKDGDNILRPVGFQRSQDAEDLDLDRRRGVHFNIKIFGASEQYKKDGKIETRDVQACACAALTHGAVESEDVDEILRLLANDARTELTKAQIEALEEYCLFCGVVERNKDSEDGAEKRTAKDLRAKSRYLMNLADRNDKSESPDGKIKIYELGPQAYDRMLNIVESPHYEDVLDDENGRDFVFNKSGSGFDTEYTVVTMPEDSPVGEPAGEPTNFFDKGFSDGVLRCWSIEEQETILTGGTVIRPDKDEDADIGPAPKCFDKAMKDDSDMCKACKHAPKCDAPKDKKKKKKKKGGKKDKKKEAAGAASSAGTKPASEGSILDKVKAAREERTSD